MAMITCAECGSAVSSEAKTCPGCGVERKVFRRSGKVKEPASGRKKLAVGFAVFVGVCIVGLASSLPANNAGTAPEDLATRQQHGRTSAAFASARALKASLRNPDSLTFRSIGTNDDGGVVCITYRAQNGFGGMNLEHVVFRDGDPSQSAAAWNRTCAHKKLYDLLGVASLTN